LIGFFSIENETNGVKITSTSPPDGNNYTSGLTSNVIFDKVFINPNFSTSLIINTEIESELQDQINFTDTIQINCPSSAIEIPNNIKTKVYFNPLGKNTNKKKYSMRVTENKKLEIVVHE